MANAKFVKTAAAVALGASVVTTAVAPGAASAATTYKIKDGKLYKNGKIAKGYVVYKGKLYKNGKLNKGYAKVGTGSKMKLYYNSSLKKGFKTANNATLLFKDGVLYKGYKQAGSNERLYKDGKLTTGWIVYTNDEGTKYLYSKGYLYKGLKTATRSGVKNLFENGVLAEGTKEYKDELFIEGVLAEGVKEFDGVTYIDGKKDVAKPEITAEDQTIEYGAKDVDVLSFAKVEDNSKEEIKAEAKISFDGKDVEKIDTKKPGVYTVTFTAKDKNGNEAEAKEVKVTVAEAAKAEVESVTAINAKTIEVKFNKAVDATQAKTSSNYSATGADLTGANYELSEDQKTVTIELASTKYLASGTTASITVKPILTKDDATAKTALYTNTLTFVDTEKPTFVDVKNEVKGEITANFSEALDPASITAANIKVTKADGTPVAIGNETGALTLTATDNGFKLSGLEDNEEYKITVVNFKDLVGNLTSPNLVEFTAKSTAAADKVAPKVTNVASKGLDTVVISVDEELKNLASGSDPAKYVNLTGVTATNDAQVYDKKAGTVTVKISLETEGATKTIKVSGYKDLSDNPGADFSKTVGFTNISKVTKTELVSKSLATGATAKDYVKVTFDKEITKGSQNAAVTATLLTKDNVKKTVTIPVANFIKGTADDETNVLYVEVEGLTGLEEGTLSFDLTSGATGLVSTLKEDAKIELAYKAISSDKTLPALATTVDGSGAITDNAISVLNDQVTVNYTQDMGASALDVNNYTVGGEKVFESAVFNTNKKTVVLTIKPGAIKLDGTYDVKIAKAVSNEKGLSLASDYETTEYFVSTVQPTATKANLSTNGTASTIAVTFDKNVTVSQNAFDVYIGGVKVEATTAAVSAAAGTATITLANALTLDNLDKEITIKIADKAVIKDANNNKLKDFGTITVSK